MPRLGLRRHLPLDGERTDALDGWLWHYNHRRRHSALGHQPPVSRTILLGPDSEMCLGIHLNSEQLPREGLESGEAGQDGEDLDLVAAGEDVDGAAALGRPGCLSEVGDLDDGERGGGCLLAGGEGRGGVLLELDLGRQRAWCRTCS